MKRTKDDRDFSEYTSGKKLGIEFLSTKLPQMRTIPVSKSIHPHHKASTFDEAFGDKQWAAVARRDPKVLVQIPVTLGAVLATVTTGQSMLDRAASSSSSSNDESSSWTVPLLAVHAEQDCRTQVAALQEFVRLVGPKYAQGYWLDDTTGHQLLQDREDVTLRVMDKVASWILEQVKKTSK